MDWVKVGIHIVVEEAVAAAEIRLTLASTLAYEYPIRKDIPYTVRVQLAWPNDVPAIIFSLPPFPSFCSALLLSPRFALIGPYPIREKLAPPLADFPRLPLTTEAGPRPSLARGWPRRGQMEGCGGYRMKTAGYGATYEVRVREIGIDDIISPPGRVFEGRAKNDCGWCSDQGVSRMR